MTCKTRFDMLYLEYIQNGGVSIKKQTNHRFTILLSLLLAVFVSVSLCVCAAAADNGISYINRVWTFGTNVVTATQESLTEPAKAFPGALDSGWYVISSDQTVSDRITVPAGSTVNLLLCDGATLTCSEGIGVAYGATLNIYGQKGNTGKLVATGDTYYAGIGGNDETAHGNINIYGGVIEATGGEYRQYADPACHSAAGPFLRQLSRRCRYNDF